MKNTYIVALIISITVVGIGAFTMKTNDAFAQYYENRIPFTPKAQFVNKTKTDRKFPPYEINGNSKIFRSPLMSERIFVNPATKNVNTSNFKFQSTNTNYYAPNSVYKIKASTK
ncbi:MAG: hypothetical protein WC735_02690 [Candidatus Paceibacterota bacterium]|jgi:hypothetical protein